MLSYFITIPIIFLVHVDMDSFPRPDCKSTPKPAPKLPTIPIIVAATTAALIGAAQMTGSSEDRISPAEIARRASIAEARPPVALRSVERREMKAAMLEMALSSQAQESLEADIASRQAKLVWIVFYDSDAEDGDVIEIQSGGFSRMIRLAKQPVAVAIPFPSDGVATVIGVVDGGGGGVTVGLVGPDGAAPLAVLSVGQQISIPVILE